MSQGEPDKILTTPLTPGRRLVIEHVSAFLGVPSGQKVQFNIGTRVAGQLRFHKLIAVEQGSFPQVLGLGPKDTFVASQPIRMYADPGSDIFFSLSRTSTSGEAAGDAVITGHWIDPP